VHKSLPASGTTSGSSGSHIGSGKLTDTTGITFGRKPDLNSRSAPEPGTQSSTTLAAALTDNRYENYSYNSDGTPNSPYPGVGFLQFNYPNNGARAWCTAWMESPGTLVTAGHCVYTPANLARTNNLSAGWNTNFVFYPSLYVDSTVGRRSR
jgi:hypothetical protein